MKKFILSLIVASFPAWAFAASSDDPATPDVVCWGTIYTAAGSTDAICVDNSGDLVPGLNRNQDIGRPGQTFKFGYFGGVSADSGVVAFHESFVDLSSGNVAGLRNLGFAISSSTLINGTSTYGSGFAITQPTGAPRNITIYVGSSSIVDGAGGGFSTMTLAGSATFYGLDAFGLPVQEMIRFSTTSVSWSTQTVTNSSDVVRYVGIGNVAFAQISSFTVQITSASNGLISGTLVLKIGYGQKIGLSNNVEATGDVYMVTEAGGGNTTLNSLLVINSTFDTVIFSALPNGIDDKQLWGIKKRNR